MPIEWVDIHFDSAWSNVVGFSIKPHGYHSKFWGNAKRKGEDVTKKCDTQNVGFFAFLLAIIGAAKAEMRVDSVVLTDEPANTLYSVNDSKLWAKHLLIFQTDSKPPKSIKLGNFRISGKPATSNPATFFLRAPLTVTIYNGDYATKEYHLAEGALKQSYDACKVKHSRFAGSGWKPNNLPGSRCDKFVPRPKIEEALEKALRSDRPVIWVYGEEGAGKAEAARHVLAERLQNLPFDKAVWIDIRPNSVVQPMGVKDILSELGRELEMPKLLPAEGVGDLSLAARELSRQAVLLVLRHFEEITTPEVFGWLSRMARSKAIVLSCKPPEWDQAEYCREVKVLGFSPDERDTFLAECLNNADGHLSTLSPAERDVLLRVTGSNPLRIMKAISFLQHGGALEELDKPQFIRKLVPASINLFSKPSVTCLLGLSLFPYGADIEALAKVTQLGEDAIEQALHPLGGFVDVCRRETISHASLMILADQGTGYALQQQHRDLPDFKEMRNSWYRYFEEKAAEVGFCWDDVEKLRRLDSPVVAKNLSFVLREALREKRYDLAITIGRECRYWQYVRGDWLSDWSPIETWANAARAADHKKELFDAVVYKLNIRSKQAKHSAAALLDADALMAEASWLKKTAKPPKLSLDRYQHARALWEMAHGELQSAAKRWRKMLLGSLEAHDKSAMKRWYAVCLHQQGKQKAARTAFKSHLTSVEGKFERSALMTHLNLVELDLEDGKFGGAKTRLESVRERIHKLGDVSFIADWSFMLAKCLAQANDSEAFQATAAQGIQFYEALGKEGRVKEIREMMEAYLQPA